MNRSSKLTISEVVTAYEINRSTLNSWVRNQKIKSRKTLHGKKEIILVDVASLEAHLAARDSARNSKPAAKPESVNTQNEERDAGEDPPLPQPDRGETISPKSGKKGRKKPRVKSPRQQAKNAMRQFSNADLLNVQSWITQRLEARLEEADEPVAP